MDIKEYIASGIIESYALGAVSDQERREVECLSAIYPEIRQELLAAQSSFEEFALAMAKEPPAGMKNRVLEAIQNTEQEIPGNAAKATREAPVVQMKPAGSDRSSIYKWTTGIAAACIIGLLFLFYTSKSESEFLQGQVAELRKSESENADRFENQMAELRLSLNESESVRNLIMRPGTETVTLSGTPSNEDARARVYWNRDEERVMLAVDNLPTPDEDKQYQLWAIVDGKPMDLGVFDIESAGISSNVPMKEKNVQAFAITLEKKGGSPTPTLEQLKVIGNTTA